MKTKIAEVRNALEKRLYYCALALLLTLPDICAKVEYPNSYTYGKNYTLWFDTHAKKYFTVIPITIPPRESEEYTWLTGEECWKLRCAVLHAGNFKLNCKNSNLKKLFIHISENNENRTHSWRNERCADIDLKLLCDNICKAVEEYYEKHPNKELFCIDEVEICTW